MNNKTDLAIVIPAFDPDDRLLKLVDELIEVGFDKFIIVNDGSGPQSKEIFCTLAAKPQCRILEHAANLGKGRALKTGFTYFLENFKDCIGAVTADAAGQHSVLDVERIGEKLQEHPNNLIIGSRKCWSREEIVSKKRLLNWFFRYAFYFFTGIKVMDTQTGLRGIPASFMPVLVKTKGEKFDYEMNMLLECKQRQIRIEEIFIEIAYISKNRFSHFKNLRDVLQILIMFLSFISTSLFSFGIDLGLFVLFSLRFHIVPATIFARIISSFVNYLVNRKVVFRNQVQMQHTLIKYYSLALVVMLISAFSVWGLHELAGGGKVGIKIFVDAVLFVISYHFQREWVFKNRSRKKRP